MKNAQHSANKQQESHGQVVVAVVFEVVVVAVLVIVAVVRMT